MTLVKRRLDFIVVIAFILGAFGFGGASRESLELQAWHSLFGWLALFAIFVFYTRKKIAVVPKTPLILFGLLLLWGVIQIIPFPQVWLDGSTVQENILLERELLNIQSDYLTLSLTPGETIRSLFAFGGPLYLFYAVSMFTYEKRRWTVYLLLGLGTLSLMLGVAQLYYGANSTLYYWKISNLGSPVGVFANVNHQATLLVALIPFLVLQYSRNTASLFDNDKGAALKLGLLTLLLMFLCGVILAGSLAGYMLTVIVLSLSALNFWWPKRSKKSRKQIYALIAAGLTGLAMLIIGGLLFRSELTALINNTTELGDSNRLMIWARSFEIWKENFIFGTGYGSFDSVYKLYESSETVFDSFINHAHNDWLQLWVELGTGGFLIVLAFAVFVGKQALEVVIRSVSDKGDRQSKAALLALMVIALHSFVDYPLRTPFVSSVFAVLLAFISTKPALEAKRNKSKIRHYSI